MESDWQQAVVQEFAAGGFEPPASEIASSFGVCLLYLAKRQSRSFIRDFLALPACPFLVAMKRVTQGPFSTLANPLALALSDNLAEAAPRASFDEAESNGDFQEGVGELATFLALPLRCGFFLSPSRLRLWQRHLGVGGGVVSRVTAIEQLFRQAGRFDCLQELLQLLEQEMESWLQDYSALPSGLEPFSHRWQLRLQQSLRRVAVLRQQAQAFLLTL